MWLGGMRFADDWIDFGKAGTNEHYMTYTKWAKGEPNGRNSCEECLALGTILTLGPEPYTTQWNDVPCNSHDKFMKGFICGKRGTKKGK